MQVKSIEDEHSTILSTFIKLPFVIKIFVMPIFEWPFYTGFTVQCKLGNSNINISKLRDFSKTADGPDFFPYHLLQTHFPYYKF